MDEIKDEHNISEELIKKFAPKIVEGVDKLKKWSKTL